MWPYIFTLVFCTFKDYSPTQDMLFMVWIHKIDYEKGVMFKNQLPRMHTPRAHQVAHQLSWINETTFF